MKSILKQKMLLSAAAVAGAMGAAVSAQGAEIIGFDVSGRTSANTSATPISATTLDSGVTNSLNLSIGAGVTASTTAKTFGGTHWNSTTEAAAITANQYLTFGLTVQAGKTVSLSEFDATFRISGTGPTSEVVQYQLGAGSFTDIGTYSLNNSTATASPLSLSGVSALQNLAPGSVVNFRLVAFGASSSAGTFFIADADQTAGTASDLKLLGTSGISGAPSVQYWDVNGAASGLGGSGTWDNSTTNFNDVTGTGAPTAYFNGVPAVFAGTGGNVTVAATGISLSSTLSVSSTGYVFSGGNITLSTGASIDSSVDTTISAALIGTGSLVKTNTGVLTLTATNTYTGGTFINGVLAISSDANLGGTSDGVTFGGGTLAAGGFATDAARSFAGTGTLDIANGTSLTIAGSTSFASLTTNDTGTLILAGASNAATTLNLTAPTTVSITGGPLVTNNIRSTVASGQSATVDGSVSITGATLTLGVADGTTLVASGNITGIATSTVARTVGGGTLVLTGAASTFKSIRIGIAGDTPTDGGTVRFDNAGALGLAGDTLTNGIQLNKGKLQYTGVGVVTIQKSLSLGANDVTLAGGDMTFTSTLGNSMFRVSGDTYAPKITVENNTTFQSDFAQFSVSSPGLLISGPGSLTLNAATNTFADAITLSGVTLAVNGSLVSPVTLTNSATLKGTGAIAGSVAVTSGTVAPGNGVGTLTTGGLNMSAGTVSLELSSSGSDELVVTAGGVTIGGASLTATSTGTYTAGQKITILANQTGNAVSGTFNGLAENATVFAGPDSFTIDYFGNGANDIVLTAVPEPGTISLLALAGAGLLARRCRRIPVSS